MLITSLFLGLIRCEHRQKSQVSQVFQDKKSHHEFLSVEMHFYLLTTSYCNYEWL